MKYELRKKTEEAEFILYQDSKKLLDNALSLDNSKVSSKQQKKLNQAVEKESTLILSESLKAISENPQKSDIELLPIVLFNLSKSSKIRFVRKLSKNALKYINEGKYKLWNFSNH